VLNSQQRAIRNDTIGFVYYLVYEVGLIFCACEQGWTCVTIRLAHKLQSTVSLAEPTVFHGRLDFKNSSHINNFLECFFIPFNFYINCFWSADKKKFDDKKTKSFMFLTFVNPLTTFKSVLILFDNNFFLSLIIIGFHFLAI
jgi:hypothetical protein